MIDMKIETAYADGETLDTMGKLLMRRAEVLGESSKDAAIAILINTLKSVRARTLTAIKRTKFGGTKVENTGWYGGFQGKEHRRIIRAGTKHDSAIVSVPTQRVKWVTQFEKKQSRRKVWRIIPEHEGVKPYYVVAASKAQALKFETAAATHRADRYGNLARNALGVAMNKLSTKKVDNSGKTICKNAASRLSTTVVTQNGTDFSVTVTDNLQYAIPAIKGGQSQIETALKMAARKMAGRLAQVMKSKGLKEKIEMPFPEVAKKR